jgi:hypothetical protein
VVFHGFMRFLRLCIAVCAALLFAGATGVGRASAVAADNPPPADAIGAIEGDAIFVQGPMSVDSVNGQIKTFLRSGSDVVVKSGQAHIDLVDGGNITICGPAHFSVLKSGSALTVALDNGTIHAHIEGALALNVYTAQIQARPVAIGSEPQDFILGLTTSGAMCFHASKGAISIEQQLTGQSLMIPQDGEVSMSNGQMDTLQNSPGRCVCELQVVAKNPVTSVQVSALPSADEVKKKPADPKPTVTQTNSVTTEEPVYQVFMPPLRYNANMKVQPDYDPKLVMLVRRARVRPALVFQGKVEGENVVAQATPPPALSTAQKPSEPKKPAEDSTWNRVRAFFHRLWSPRS